MSFMPKVSRLAARLTTLGVVSAAATTLLFTGTASAAVETKCNTYYCNQTVGTGNYVQYINASKRAPIAGTYGFFEVFGRGWKKTDISTTANSRQISISRSVQLGELVCLRYFQNVSGQWIEKGSAVCTSAPIG